jgi:hypothetical protein
VFGKNVPVITYESTIQLFKAKLEKSIDDAINQVEIFKPNCQPTLSICTPFQAGLVTVGYALYLKKCTARQQGKRRNIFYFK